MTTTDPFTEAAMEHLAKVDHDKSRDWFDGFVACTQWAQRYLAARDARVRAEAVAPVLALHNADGKRWEGFPRADRRVTYCTHCQLAAPCPSVRAVSIEQETQP